MASNISRIPRPFSDNLNIWTAPARRAIQKGGAGFSNISAHKLSAKKGFCPPSPFSLLPSPFSLLPSPFFLLPSSFFLLPSSFSLLPSPLPFISFFKTLLKKFPRFMHDSSVMVELDLLLLAKHRTRKARMASPRQILPRKEVTDKTIFVIFSADSPLFLPNDVLDM